MNEARRPNALIHEASPYLLQHARNPVDWFPWSDAAFERAEREQKPVFLSVGYAACHWCHVMERESFENTEIAAYLNQHFVSVKVDREERPDVDHHYMSIVQSLTGSGGWPMSVFLTPQRRAFYGGTYWPATSNYGRPGFLDVLRAIVDAWTQRRDDVLQTADAIQESVARLPTLDGRDLHESFITRAVDSAKVRFDRVYGGFGAAPKFPHAMELCLLLRVGARSGDVDALHMVRHTLRKMVRGGIFDQIGGGFHRYSTDAHWLVPHFEKMLYDNALLIPLCLDAGALCSDAELMNAARESLEWVLRELEQPEGGFASSLDADADGEEGMTYVWTPDEIRAVLGPERGERFARLYDIRDDGNFEHGKSIPNLPEAVALWAAAHDTNAELLAAELQADRHQLRIARSQRSQPARDDKVLTDWNGFMITALVRGYHVLGDERYLAAAERYATRVNAHFARTGRLPHSLLGDRVQETQFLLDHAALGCGVLDLFGATGDREWLDFATALADRIETEFGRGEGLYTMSEHAVAGIDPVDPYDSAMPSGISMAVMLGVRLYQLTSEERFRMRAETQLRKLAAWIERAPAAFSQALVALESLLHPPAQLVIVGDSQRHLWSTASQCPAFAVTTIWRCDSQTATDGLAALLKTSIAMDGQPTAYLCRDYVCERPVCSAPELAEALRRAVPTLVVN